MSLKSIGMFIFTGSATFGVEEAGYNIDKVLEISADMLQENAYHFVKNRPDINLITPEVWENDSYLEALKKEDYDLLYSNCPCSSLSQINRNASVNGAHNVHFYRAFKAINKIQPKVFFIENAPTLVKLGYPILKDMIKELGSLYHFTIARDYAANHGVAMRRMRTLVIGWRRDLFDGKIPLLNMNHKKLTTTKDIIGDLYEYDLNDPRINNHNLIFDPIWSPVEHLFNYVDTEKTALVSFIEKWDELDNKVTNENLRKGIARAVEKIKTKGKLWDKSPYRVSENSYCPSMTSVTKIMHPKYNRTFTVREYARLMGYPDDFIFYPDECKIPVIQCISQGVPAKFVSYVASEIKAALEGQRALVENSEDKVLIFQHHTHKVWKAYTQNEIDTFTELDHNKQQGEFFDLNK